MEAEFSRIEIIGSMSKVSAFIEMLSSKHIKEIHKLGISGITVYNAMGCGVQSGSSEYMLDFTEQPLRLLPKSTMIMICETSKVKEVIEFLKKEFYTGHIGDGKIFVSDVRNIIRQTAEIKRIYTRVIYLIFKKAMIMQYTYQNVSAGNIFHVLKTEK